MNVMRRRLIVLAVGVMCGCTDFDRDRYLPTSPDTQNALLLASAAPSVRADGGSRVRIEARIDPGSAVRTVTFTTTLGTLFAGSGSATASGTGLNVTADLSGIAAVELQADVHPGTARVTASMTLNTTPAQTLARTIDIQFTAVGPGEIVVLTASPTSAEADGATHIRLVAIVATTLPAGGREVTFTASDGEFATNVSGTDTKVAKVIADASNTASVELIAPKTQGRVSVTVSVSNFSARTEILFDRATPDVIFVELDKSALTRMGADSATVTVTLLRDIGQVANNTVVTFEARDATGALRGMFSKITLAKEVASNAEIKDVKATAEFDPDDLAAAGIATITARVGSKSGSVPITLN